MRLKKFGALLLAGAMMTGTIGVMSPTQAKATETNTYTMTVPADTAIQSAGWKSLGNITITGTVDTGKKVTVTAKTTNNFALKSGDNSVSYTMKTASTDKEAKTSFEFDAASINAGSASQTIGVDVEDFSGKAAGTYTDTITFTGTMSDAGSTGGTPQVSDVFKEGAQVEVRLLENNGYSIESHYYFSLKYANNKYRCDKVEIDGQNYTDNYASACTAKKNEQSVEFNFMGDIKLKVDTTNNTYRITNVMDSYSYSLEGFLINGTDIKDSLVEQKTPADISTCKKFAIKFSTSGNSHEILFEKDGVNFFSAASYKYNNEVCATRNAGADIISTTVKISTMPDFDHNYTLCLDTDSGEYYCYEKGNENNLVSIEITEFKVDDVDITNQLSPTTPQ